MNSYFSTFITGFDAVVGAALSAQVPDVEILLLTDGLVVYETSRSMDEIRKLRFFNNSFVLLRKFEQVDENSISRLVKDLIADGDFAPLFGKHFPRRQLRFRIRATVRNQFVAIDKNLLKRLEERIVNSVRNLQVDRSLPDLEFLISIRSEGFGLVGIQFSRRPDYEKSLQKGELYPELAYLLCLISEPSEDDVFFDPFAGYGAIVAQRLNFPYREIVAGEIDRDLQLKLQQRFGKKVRVEDVDALSLSMIPDSLIDRIVTDPPWGLYEKDLDVPVFYESMLQQFYRVLKPGGILVLLTAQKEQVESLINQFAERMVLVETYSTLVSGKKAGVYKIKKVG